MRVLLTGAFGNVGSHTLPQLIEGGHRVRCLDLPRPAHRRAARRLPAGAAEIVWADITDAAAVARAMDGMQAVVHLAAVIPPEADEEPEWARSVNVDGMANVIAACHSLPQQPRLLFTSTLDVHGDTSAKAPPRRVDDPMVATKSALRYSDIHDVGWMG